MSGFFCAVLCAAHFSSYATPAGLWLLSRKDPANTARCDVPGHFRSAPKEVWRIGATQRHKDWLRPVTVGGEEAYLVRAGTALELVRSDGSKVWQNSSLGVDGVLEVLDFGAAGCAALATHGRTEVVQVDLATGRKVWNWTTPEGTMISGPIPDSPVVWKQGDVFRLAVFPQTSVQGIAFEFSQPDAPPRQLWQQDYAGKYWANFGPYGVTTDLNNDGRQDILLAGKPSYVAAIDGDSGKILFDCHYPISGEANIGRPYGLVQATDIDGDGFADAVVVSCAVEEYVAVLKNEGGKSFRFMWSHFVEQDLPEDKYELHPQTTSVADVDGDGRKELVLGLFNLTGDQRWHTVVLDAFGGWDARKHDLSGRYFWGCYDLNGDGVPEVITSEEKTRLVATNTTLQAVDGHSGRDIATIANRALVTATRPLPPNVGFYSKRETPCFAVLSDGVSGLIVRVGKTSKHELWRIKNGKSVLTRFAPSAISQMAFSASADDHFGPLQREIKEPQHSHSLAASQPLVAVADGKRELIFTKPDGTVVGGTPDWHRPGILKKSWCVRGVCPAVWIGPSGERVVATFDATADRFYLYRPKSGQRLAPPSLTVDLPFEPFREPGMVVPFGRTNLLVYVTMKRGLHPRASALFDGNGRCLWRDDTEGAHPRQPSVFVRSDGQTNIVVDNHGKILFYNLAGHKQVIAHGWHTTVPGRGNGAKYALPICGSFSAQGEPRIILSPGLEQLEILDEHGARVAMTPYGSIYEREACASTVAHIQTNTFAVGMVTRSGIFHCTDVATGRDRWTFDLGAKTIYPVRMTAGDLDGDGRDNFLVGLANGDLIALAERNGKGFVLWKTHLDAAIRDTEMADLDGDGLAEIIVETDDGRIRIMSPAEDKP